VQKEDRINVNKHREGGDKENFLGEETEKGDNVKIGTLY